MRQAGSIPYQQKRPSRASQFNLASTKFRRDLARDPPLVGVEYLLVSSHGLSRRGDLGSGRLCRVRSAWQAAQFHQGSHQ